MDQNKIALNVNKYAFIFIAFSYLVKFIFLRNSVGLNEHLSIGQLICAYLINIAVAFVIAGIVFVDRKRIFSLCLLIFTDIWILANLLYYNANQVIINWSAVETISQLHGFENAIVSYLHWTYLMFPVVTIGVCCFLFSDMSNWYCDWKRWWIVFSVSISLYIVGIIGTHLFRLQNDKYWELRKEENTFIKTHSPFAQLGYIGINVIQEIKLNKEAQMPFSQKEVQLISSITTIPAIPQIPQSHFIFILVESFESWTLNIRDQQGIEVCENLNHFIATHPVLFSPGIISQQRYGRSGDGQLITQTGLLPLSHGVTCMKYGDNTYPNYAHFFPQSIILNPFRGVWNQRVTTYSYGYKQLKESQIKFHETDSIIFVQARDVLSKAHEPTCVLALTINTHAPFTSVPKTLSFGEQFTSTEKDYLQSVHYMDTHLGRFLAWADTASTMKDATIVISADHNHFPRKGEKGLCPLVILSPKINHYVYKSFGYQMDIFPTILSLIEQDNYFWKGFGVNLLDSTADRQFSIEQVERLSDKLIRKNYFSSFQNNMPQAK